MSMESADYLQVDGNDKPVFGSDGKGVLLAYGSSSGTFDLSFDATKSLITATVKVLVIPKTVRLHNPLNKEPLTNSDGTPETAPFETMKERLPSNKATRVIEDRPVSALKNLPTMKLRIEEVLNQNKYSMTIAKCPQANACTCQVGVQFMVEFVTNKADEHHAVVNLFPQAERADAGNWGEVNVQFRGSSYQPIRTEHVQAHEIGHLFSFPDEYYAGGGAVHRQYIKADKTVNLTLANNNPNKDTWQGVTSKNLMGLGVYNTVADTPSYYFYRIRDWFHEKTGREWTIVPHNEAK